MKILKNILNMFLLLGTGLYAQEIEVITHGMTKYEPVGTFEIVIDFQVVNVSADTQIVFEVRTINDMPSGWSSSMCFGILCFAPDVDSVATTPNFSTPAVAPGDTLPTSIHVYTDQVSIATSHIQIEVGTFNNPNERIVLDFTLTTDPSVSVENENSPNDYFLSQNFPNPFNPSTQISYGLKEGGFVSLKIYNILGAEIATLVNEYKSLGNYTFDFNNINLSSGVYLYRLSVNNFVQTRKMILEK